MSFFSKWLFILRLITNDLVSRWSHLGFSARRFSFETFQSGREMHLARGDLLGAKRLELTFLRRNPRTPRAWFMHAWTLMALGQANAASHANQRLKLTWEYLSKVRKREIVKLTYSIGNQVFPGEKLHKEKKAIQDLISAATLDEVWGWYTLVPEITGSDGVAESPLGWKFKIESPDAVIEKRLCRGMLWEPFLQAVMVFLHLAREKGASTPGAVVDVGANVGANSVVLALQLGVEIWAFEPEPENFRRLEGNVALNDLQNIRIIQSAVSAVNGVSQIRPGPDSNPGLAALSDDSDYSKVSLVTLDSVFRMRRVSMLKIDVEGHELGVLEGAKNVLIRDKPLIFVELLTEENFLTVNSYLNQFGYQGKDLGVRNFLFYVERFTGK